MKKTCFFLIVCYFANLAPLYAQEWLQLQIKVETNLAKGNYSEAVKICQDAKEKYLKTIGKESDYAWACNLLGKSYETMYEMDIAENAYLEALETVRSMMRKNNAKQMEVQGDLCVYNNNLALVYLNNGKYTQADTLYYGALPYLPKAEGIDQAAFYNTFAMLSSAKLNHKLAVVLYEKADSVMNILRTMPQYKIPQIKQEIDKKAVFLYNNWATSLTSNGNYEEAEKMMQNNLQKISTSLSSYDDTLTYLVLQNNFAMLLEKQKQVEKATNQYNVSIKLANSLSRNKVLVFANLLHNAGKLKYNQQGDNKESEEYLWKSKKILEEIKIKNHIYYEVCYFLAYIYTRRNEADKAYDLFKEANNTQLEYMRKTFFTLSKQEKDDLLQRVNVNSNLFNNFVIKNYKNKPHILQDAFNMRINLKSKIYESIKEFRKAIQSSQDTTIQKLYNDWNKAMITVNRMQSIAKDDVAYQAKLNQAIQKRDELEVRLSVLSKLFVEATKKYEWKDLQNRIQKNEVLVDIIKVVEHQDNYFEKIKQTYYMALFFDNNKEKNTEVVILSNGDNLETIYKDKYNQSQVKEAGNVQRIKEQEQYKKEVYANYWQPIQKK